MDVEAKGNRVSLVTGGTGGIGRAVAMRLARGGDRVLFVGRSPERGAEVLAALREVGPQADHIFSACGLVAAGETARVADDVARQTDRLNATVFCAGILSTVPEWTDEGLERNFVLNYLSRFLLVRRLLPLLTDAPPAAWCWSRTPGSMETRWILTTCSIAGASPGCRSPDGPSSPTICSPSSFADRLRGTRVEVTCVYPGLTKTEVFGNAVGLPGIASTAGASGVALVWAATGGRGRDPVLSGAGPSRHRNRRSLLRARGQ